MFYVNPGKLKCQSSMKQFVLLTGLHSTLLLIFGSAINIPKSISTKLVISNLIKTPSKFIQ